MLVIDYAGFAAPLSHRVHVVGDGLGGCVGIGNSGNGTVDHRRYVHLLPCLAGQRLLQRLTGLYVTSRETPKARISLSMGAASSEKYASLPQEQSIDNVPHSAVLGWCATKRWQPRAA